MKAVVAAFNQEKALVGAFSVITNLRMDLFEAWAAEQGKYFGTDLNTRPPTNAENVGSQTSRQITELDRENK